MKSFLRTILMITATVSMLFASGQGIGIGQWRDHLPYNHCIAVADAGNKVYAATPYSVFYYNKLDFSLNRLTKINGLSDQGVAWISYSYEYKTLVIGYKNTNIDLIRNNSIINIPDIERKPILGNKTINKIMFIDSYAYLSCGFGIVVLDVLRNEVKDTYFIGPEGSHINVLDMAYDGEKIYAATESGIYYAMYDHPNLADYAAWTKDTLLPHPGQSYNAITVFGDRIYANNSHSEHNSDTLYYFDPSIGEWDYFNKEEPGTLHSLRSDEEYLIVSSDGDVSVYDKDHVMTGRTYVYIQPDEEIIPAPRDAMYDKDGMIWIADRYNGLVKIWHFWTSTLFKPNGPSSHNVFRMDAANSGVWVAPGGRDPQYANTFIQGSMFSYIDNEWTYYDWTNTDYLLDFNDIVSVLIDPTDNHHVYMGSWGSGLMEIKNGNLENTFNGNNSSLRPPHGGDLSEVRVGGLIMDRSRNLWVSNSNADNILSVMMASDGKWQSFNLGALAFGAGRADVGDLEIDQFNQKWIVARGDKVIVFNDNNTITQTNDDRAKVLNNLEGNGKIPGNRVLSIAVDLDGEVWIGTDEGVAVFYAPGNVFTNYDFDAQRILVEVGGHVQYLLETEDVTSIAVDGANRKWFGTDRAGVFLMSDDGTEQIHHFTEDNSPLISNSITDITINHITGEVFIGTAEGIVSYRASATTGGETNENVYAYPNPVREGYQGPIAIKGLVRDADIKITDISGALIYSTRAEGGQAVWDGRNFSGERAQTGVYLVFISNDDGSQTMVTKILVMN